MTIVTPLLYRSMLDNPWSVFRQVHEDLNNFLGEVVSEVSVGYPPVNIWFSDTEAVVEAELPGVDVKDLDLTVTGHTLSLKGSRKSSAIDEAKVLKQERGFGEFGRNIQLPFDVESNSIKASLKDGILKLTLPRKEEETPRKLKVLADK